MSFWKFYSIFIRPFCFVQFSNRGKIHLADLDITASVVLGRYYRNESGTKPFRTFPSFRLLSGSPLVIAFSEWKLIRIRRWRGTSRRSLGLPFSNPLQVACRLARSAQAYLKAIHTRAGAGVSNSAGCRRQRRRRRRLLLVLAHATVV